MKFQTSIKQQPTIELESNSQIQSSNHNSNYQSENTEPKSQFNFIQEPRLQVAITNNQKSNYQSQNQRTRSHIITIKFEIKNSTKLIR